jgi:hypothetical protein
MSNYSKKKWEELPKHGTDFWKLHELLGLLLEEIQQLRNRIELLESILSKEGNNQ